VALLLRGNIDNRRWDWAEGDIPWLPAGEFPAAPLADLRTSLTSSLSVWLIEDDRSNLERVVAALTATRDHLDKYDYILFDERLIGDAGVHAEDTGGRSLDGEANDRWHRDLVQLTSSHLVQLARLIHRHGQPDRVLEPRVKELITGAVRAGLINSARLKDQLRQDVLSG